MKRKLLVAIPLLVIVVIAAWIMRPKHEYIGEAYVSTKSTALLSSVAQVRQEIGEVHYGEHVEMMAKRNEFVKVKTSAGLVGWVDAHQLMDPPLWQRSIVLLKKAQDLPVGAGPDEGGDELARGARANRSAALSVWARNSGGDSGAGDSGLGAGVGRKGRIDSRGYKKRGLVF